MKKTILTVIFSLISIIVIAQNQITVSGKIVALKTQKPIENVTVYNSNGALVATTDYKGAFNFKTQKTTDKLTFYKQGFHIAEKNIEYQKVTRINIELVAFSEELSEVQINANRRKIFALRQLKKVEGTAIYAGKKSEVVLLNEVVGNTATNNARQIYAQVVGLNIYENDDAGLQLNIGGRGLDPNRTANFNTRQNGYDMSADVLGYPESYYTPPSDALAEIQVVRGAASLQYGTQFGGLLNFKFHRPSKKEFELITRQSVGSYGLFNSFNSVSGTVDKTSYYGYINYKKGDGFRPNSKFNSFNLYANLKHDFSKKTSLALEVTYLDYLTQQAGGLTDTQFNKDIFFSNRSRNWFAVNWNLWVLKFKHDFTEHTKLTFNLFGLQASRKAIGYRGNYTLALPTNPITDEDEFLTLEQEYLNRDLVVGKYRNWGAEARFLSDYAIGNQKHTYLFGVKYYQANNSENQTVGSKGVDADFNFYANQSADYPNESRFKFPNKNLALFAENIFNLSDEFSITPGVRLEYIKTESNGAYKSVIRDGANTIIASQYIDDNRVKERNFALFGVGLSYNYNPFIELYANASQNYRSVTFNDIRTVSPSFIVDENIGDEKGGTADLGIRGKYKKYFSYDIGGFALFYNDRIGEIIEDTGKNKGDRVRTNVGDALIYGFEGFTSFNLAEIFKFNTNDYVFTNFVNLAFTDSEYRTSIQSGVVGNKVEFIPEINLKTGLKFGYKNLMSSFQFTHLSEQFTEATNARPDSQGESREGLVGEIPAYSILDASLSYTYKKWKFEAGVNNLLDERYFTRRATGYPGPGIIPSAPMNWYGTVQFKL